MESTASIKKVSRDSFLRPIFKWVTRPVPADPYAIVALAQKLGISLDSISGIKSVTTQFLDRCNWSGMSQSRQDNCRSWTNLFTAREVEFPESVIGNFCAFVDHMSCSAQTYVSLGGSNGCADQLTNWDGTQKQGLGAPKKKDKGMSM